MEPNWGQSCLTRQLSPITFWEGGSDMFNKSWSMVKHTLVGVIEALALGTMIGASVLERSFLGTVEILFGLLLGVIGLAIYDVWRV